MAPPKWGKLNVDENPATARKLGIRSIPTVLFFDKGRMVDSTIGVVPKQELRSKLKAPRFPLLKGRPDSERAKRISRW